jgi:protein-S-isoprenylcysteine O-methyltransferase Ste14
MVYKIIYGILWLGFLVIRLAYYKNDYTMQEKKKTVRPVLAKFLFILTILLIGVLPFVFIIRSPAVFVVKLPDWLVITSLVMLALSLVLFLVVHKRLGKNWSPLIEIRKEHTLVTSGIYRYIRHPMYTQISAWALLQGFAIQNWLVMVFGILAWGILYFFRIPEEEKMLIDVFGDEYKKYMHRTGRLLPQLTGKRSVNRKEKTSITIDNEGGKHHERNN